MDTGKIADALIQEALSDTQNNLSGGKATRP
jgi:hypothetical protein